MRNIRMETWKRRTTMPSDPYRSLVKSQIRMQRKSTLTTPDTKKTRPSSKPKRISSTSGQPSRGMSRY